MLSDWVSPSSFAACGPSRSSYMAFSAWVAEAWNEASSLNSSL